MLNTLIASQAPRTRTASAQFLSLTVHGTLLAGAVFATQRASVVMEPVRAEPTVWVNTPKPVEPRHRPPAIATPRGFQLLPTLIDIPTVIPDIDLTRSITVAEDYLDTRGVPGGTRLGVEPIVTGVMTAEQVDRAASLMAGYGRPVYPEALRSAGASGEVLVQVVIDTLGRAEMATLAIVSSTHEKFSEAVTRALAKARFAPASFAGHKVRQLVRMPFVFSLQRK